MIAVRVVSAGAVMVYPFVILNSTTLFDLNPSQVATLVYFEMAGTVLGGVIWGNVSHRFGNKYVITASQITALALSLLVLFSRTLLGSSTPFALLWFLSLMTGINVAAWFGFLNYTIDIAGRETRSAYLVMTSIIAFPLAFLSFFAGLIADRIGLPSLFLFGGVAAAIAFLISLRLESPYQPGEPDRPLPNDIERT